MITDFAGLKIISKDVWDLQTKLISRLTLLEKERSEREAKIAEIRKQEKMIRDYLGQQRDAVNGREDGHER